jgi:uncharacterized protein (DUF952 family)
MHASVIYHITTKPQWLLAQKNGYYTSPNWLIEGFIHCCTKNQIAGILDRYYSEQQHLLQLSIDIFALSVPVKYELSPAVNELFPHIYGIIPLQAIIHVFEI